MKGRCCAGFYTVHQALCGLQDVRTPGFVESLDACAAEGAAVSSWAGAALAVGKEIVKSPEEAKHLSVSFTKWCQWRNIQRVFGLRSPSWEGVLCGELVTAWT